MKAYSLDMREHIVQAIDRGIPKADIARVFGVALSTVKRYTKQRQVTGTIAPKPIPGRRRLLTAAHEQALLAQLHADPDARLKRHRATLHRDQDLYVSITTISRAIKRFGWTRKKKVLRAVERDEQAHAAWLLLAPTLDSRQLVFVDECSVNLAMTPRYSRAPKGSRAVGVVPRKRGANITLIASLSLQGIETAMHMEGAADARIFGRYVSDRCCCVVLGCALLGRSCERRRRSAMVENEVTCPTCGADAARKDGRDRRGDQVYRCGGCRRRFTALSATPFSGYRFPPEVIALAVRWYLRYRLSYADVAELIAERGVTVVASTIDAWVREFAPLYEGAARQFRIGVGSTWSVDATYVRIAGEWAYVYRAVDGRGQVVDVYVRQQRAAEDAAAFFRRAIEAPGVVPAEVTTDCAAAYPAALAAVFPMAAHESGKRVQQRIERDHQHRKGRIRGMRGFKTLTGASVLCRAHAFLRNLRGHFYDFGRLVDAATPAPVPPLVRVWDALTADLLGR